MTCPYTWTTSNQRTWSLSIDEMLHRVLSLKSRWMVFAVMALQKWINVDKCKNKLLQCERSIGVFTIQNALPSDVKIEYGEQRRSILWKCTSY